MKLGKNIFQEGLFRGLGKSFPIGECWYLSGKLLYQIIHLFQGRLQTGPIGVQTKREKEED